ncbi:MAG: hypothetical protein PWP65_1995 [Clostridia bacterium]|nr:hypothetical protein [Clostridia bacterium]
MEIKNRFGTITVHMPSRPPTPEEERRLYAILVECLIEECLIEKKPVAQESQNSREEKERLINFIAMAPSFSG